MKFRNSIAAALLFALTVVAHAQFPAADKPSQSSARGSDSVRYLFPEQVTIAAKRAVPVELHFRVAEGMHINSHAPHSKLLIPTNLIVAERHGSQCERGRFSGRSGLQLFVLADREAECLCGRIHSEGDDYRTGRTAPAGSGASLPGLRQQFLLSAKDDSRCAEYSREVIKPEQSAQQLSAS